MKIYVFDVAGGLPVMVKGGGFDKIRDPETITGLTGATMSYVDGRHKITFDVMSPQEILQNAKRCGVLVQQALWLEVAAGAFTAEEDEFDDLDMDFLDTDEDETNHIFIKNISPA